MRPYGPCLYAGRRSTCVCALNKYINVARGNADSQLSAVVHQKTRKASVFVYAAARRHPIGVGTENASCSAWTVSSFVTSNSNLKRTRRRRIIDGALRYRPLRRWRTTGDSPATSWPLSSAGRSPRPRSARRHRWRAPGRDGSECRWSSPPSTTGRLCTPGGRYVQL